MKKFFKAVLIITIVFTLIFTAYIIIGWDHDLTVAEYRFESDKIDKRLKIALLSDLHDSSFGNDNKELFEMLSRAESDLVLLCGDIFDDHTKMKVGTRFLDKLTSSYTVYAVMGNHEYIIQGKTLAQMKQIYRDHGVNVLENQNTVVEIRGERLNICGTDIPYLNGKLQNSCVDAALEGIDPNNYTLMLFHRPEVIEQFKGRGIDLVLSGHAHGGQWRIPGILNGIVAPTQGLFPEYAGGLYELDDGTSFIVSRGLATENTIIPRVFNPPEIVMVTLE